ncbi:MAG TPA: hypothetical protein VLU47_05450, partial [Blastocatellia bacterium]|nr:hypothetical protein [Blastocatellia bacterium]
DVTDETGKREQARRHAYLCQLKETDDGEDGYNGLHVLPVVYGSHSGNQREHRRSQGSAA